MWVESMNELINVLSERQDQLLNALIEHMQISFISLLFAVIIAIPLGVILTRNEKVAEPILGITAVIQTIPSLALLGLLIPLLGIGKIPAIIALVAYALLPILRNTYTGIKEVDPALKEAASAMGMKSAQRLMKVELPLAIPVIMAGIRTGMVLIIGTATLAALIGAGGLGDIILLGIDRNDSTLIVIGAIPAALLAILFDFILRRFQKLSFKKALVGVSIGAIIALFVTVSPYIFQQEKDLKIAGKLGSEPEILINMYKLLIEEETDLTVELQPGLGKTSFVFKALTSGSIDIYPEFTGTVIAEFLKEEAVSTDQTAVYEQAKEGIQEEFDLVLLEPMEYNNTYALAVLNEFAEEHELQTISDLKAIESMMKPGFTLEFSDREDGYIGIQELYGLSFSEVVTMEPKLRYTALENGEINLVDAYSTDSELEEYGLTVLEDDQSLFPPYQGAPLLRQETIEKYPEIVDPLNQLAGKITDDEMRKMNYAVNVDGKSAKEVAEEYLKEKGLIQ